MIVINVVRPAIDVIIGARKPGLGGQHMRKRGLILSQLGITKMIGVRDHALIGQHRGGTVRAVFKRTHAPRGITQNCVG